VIASLAAKTGKVPASSGWTIMLTYNRPTKAVSNRFRNPFAAKLLERGTSLESVSIFLGHKSMHITKKH
jgi:site-specific recombinase XerD